MDNVHFKIPPNMSILNLNSCNRIQDEDDFRENGYIWYQNERRKWFINIHGHRIWSPKLQDIPSLEALRWKVQQNCNSEAKILWKSFIYETPIGKYYGIFPGNPSRYIIMDLDKDKSVGWKDTEILHNILGQNTIKRYFLMEKRINVLNKRMRLCNTILDHALQNQIYYNTRFNSTYIQFLINDRTYLYIKYGGEYSVVWPEKVIIQRVI